MLLDGTEGQKMFDNISVSQDGKITLLEDIGNNAAVGKVWQYDPSTSQLTQIAQHDPARFDPNLNGAANPGPNFITQDEESSGVIDISSILGNAGEHVYLLDTQAHNTIPGEVAEGGQLQIIHQYPSGAPVANIALLGNYLASTFAASSDGQGGTMIVDPVSDASSQMSVLTQQQHA